MEKQISSNRQPSTDTSNACDSPGSSTRRQAPVAQAKPSSSTSTQNRTVGSKTLSHDTSPQLEHRTRDTVTDNEADSTSHIHLKNVTASSENHQPSSKWEKLSPQQFQELQEYISYASHSFKEVITRMATENSIEPDGTLDYNQFVLVMTAYLDADVPTALLQSVFRSLLKRRPTVAVLSLDSTIVSNHTASSGLGEMSRPNKLTEKLQLVLNRNSGEPTRDSCLTSSSEHVDLELHDTKSSAPTPANAYPSHVYVPPSLGDKSQSLGHLAVCCIEPQSNSDQGSGEAIVALSSKFTSSDVPDHSAAFAASQSLGDIDACIVSEKASGSNADLVSRFLLSANSGIVNSTGGIKPVSSQSSLPSNPAASEPAAFNLTPDHKQSELIDAENSSKILMRDLSCYLSLLEGGRPEDKLEFLFRLYDADGNGILDSTETEAIVNQMMNVAGYLGWECSELRPILQDMMREVDVDDDGFVSLEEWKRGGMTTIPLLVLLGLDTNVRDDGSHVWRLKHFRNASYCNLCLNLLLGLGKKGLTCVFCHYTAHEKCVQWAPQSCIATYSKSRKVSSTMYHVWIQGNVTGKCEKCRKTVKCGITGCRCRWCQAIVHNKCVQALPAECNLGPLRDHILPPTCILPVILDQQRPRRPSTCLTVAVETRRGSCGPTLMTPSTPTTDVVSTAATAAAVTAIAGASAQPQLGTTTSSAVATQPQVSSPQLHSRPASFQIQPLHGTRPLLVFVNPKSGGHQGMKILAKFQHVLNPRQVYNLIADRGPHNGLNFFRDVQNFRILCCGGDGTIGWLMDAIDKAQLVRSPPIAMLPLGTGNDLARCLRWGGGYEDEALIPLLQRISLATEVMLDRWRIEVEPTLPPLLPEGVEAEIVGDPVPFNIMNNYFSIGVDASIAHRFHMMREKHPEKFNSRMRNKLWYLELGTSETFSTNCKNLHEDVTIWCDGELLDLSRGPPLEAIAVLNIPSIYGGSNLWGDKQISQRDKKHHARVLGVPTSSSGVNAKTSIDRDPDSTYSSSSDYDFVIQDIGDKLFEVVGLENTFHAASVYAGLRTSAHRLRQCQSCTIRTKRRFPMQIDGEPWLQPPCTIRVTHMKQVPMLMAPKKKKIHPILQFLGIGK